jgi:hypothetical protein
MTIQVGDRIPACASLKVMGEKGPQGITTDELSALAKSYLGRDRVSRATVLPGK